MKGEEWYLNNGAEARLAAKTTIVVVSWGWMKKVGQVVTNNSSIRIGDVLAIPLDGHGYAYVRRYKDGVGIFELVSSQIEDLAVVLERRIKIYTWYYVPKGHEIDWVYLGKQRFEAEEETWIRALYIQDVIEPNVFRIYHRDKVVDATQEQVCGLDPCIMYNPAGLKRMIIVRMVTAPNN